MLTFLLCNPTVSAVTFWVVVIVTGLSALLVLWLALAGFWLNKVGADHGVLAVVWEQGNLKLPRVFLAVLAIAWLVALWNYEKWVPDEALHCNKPSASASGPAASAQPYRTLTPEKSRPTETDAFRQPPTASISNRKSEPDVAYERASSTSAHVSPQPHVNQRGVDTVKPSFDCAQARTPVEKMICANNSLATLDGLLAYTYDTARARSGDPDGLRKTQLQWMRERNQCTDVECIRAAYETRISALEVR